MKSTRTLLIALAVAFVFHGCAEGQQGDGLGSASVSATVPALSVDDVARIQVTVSGPNIAPDIVSDLTQDAGTGEWSGLIEDIPAGAERTFVTEAFDAVNVVIYSGTVSGVTVVDGQQVVVQFYLQQSTPPDPFANTVPLFESLVVSSAGVAPGKDVDLTVAVTDPDPGDVPTLLWTAPTGGSFDVTDELSVVWTAPSTEGLYPLTVSASDSTGATSTLTVTIDVRIYYGWGSASIQIDVNAWPQVQNLVPDPVRINVGGTTQLDLTVSDPDGDPLAYAWSANCSGTFTDISIEDPSFTLNVRSGTGVCTLTVVIDDGRGGSSTASAAIATGTPTVVASFTPLGDLPGGGFLSWAFDVSADGTVVVGYGRSPRPDEPGSANQAFRWVAPGPMVGLGDLPGGVFRSEARGVSADGTVVVGHSSSDSGTQAFRWTEAEGMVGLGGNAYGEAVSADGTVVVGADTSGGRYEAFRWTATDGMIGLGDLPGGVFRSDARGVSADGTVVVGFSESASGNEAFRWTEVNDVGVMEGLGSLPGGSSFSSSAIGVSADGSVVVGSSHSASGTEAFRWTEVNGVGAMEGLGDLPGGSFHSNAMAVSADGSVVVGASDTGSGRDYGREAIRWTRADGMRNLAELLVAQGLGADLAGWELSWADGVSADGTKIVGYGYNPDGYREAWLATLPLPP